MSSSFSTHRLSISTIRFSPLILFTWMLILLNPSGLYAQ
uniref:Uncharacterized protein n=1 Tax=Anguilla anguilla TaxID=7936 RepID=A0A0E9RY24_ANGAN